MAVSLKELEFELVSLLRPEQFSDYCPNGLQVEGRAQVAKIVSGVTASQALIDAAIEQEADAILVHHGYFWRGEDQTITGIKRQRLSRLLEHDISLFAYHLPLDAHAELGNNVQLASVLDIEVTGELGRQNNHPLGLTGKLASPLTLAAFAARVEDRLGREPQVIDGGDHQVSTVAWCTGAAQDFINQAVAAGVDAYISGEISEPTVHVAREAGIHFLAAGHHATERYGVKALGDYVAEKFSLSHRFIDIDNPA